MFKYMTRGWLIANEFIQTDSDKNGSDSEVECDLRRTERSAAKRKARLSWVRSSRVSGALGNYVLPSQSSFPGQAGSND